MSELLTKIRNLDPNDGDAAKEAVTAFFQNITKVSGIESKNDLLRSLNFVINRFPRYCMSNRIAAENFFIKYLDSRNFYNVIEVAKGTHALQQVRPSQEKIATPKTCWREQINTLCHTAHKILKSLFAKSVDLYENGSSLELQSLVNSPLSKALLNLNELSNTKTNSEKLATLSIRLRNIFVFIQAMLVETYPVAKPIRPQTILDVIVRTLSVTSGKNVGSTHDMSDICMIKIQALKTLDALVACLGSNLIPFSALVIRLPMQTLRWSADNVSEESRKVRCASYKSLSQWLTVLRQCADGGRWHDEITSHILDDVTTKEQAAVTITAQLPTKNLSKKAKRKLQNTMLQQSSLAAHMASEKNKIKSNDKNDDSVAIAALQCAEIYLTVCGAFLKPAIHKQFHERIIRECYCMTSQERCLGLLRVLEAARRSCRKLPPPTHYCLTLYSRLISSTSGEVSKFCSQALQDIRLHLHCSPPSLNFALEQQKEDKIAKNKNKSVSERNRAALEELLGSKISPKIRSIEVNDEPSAKRSKLDEDITDRISLSSDSVKSVEISSDEEVSDHIEVVEPDQDNPRNEVDEISAKQTTTIKESNDCYKNKHGTSTFEQEKPNVVEEKTQTVNIFEAKTQIPINDSNDAVDGDVLPLSNEVGYDLPNKASIIVPVLEKMEDENLPSTNETDDIQITCGQFVTNSQDGDSDKKDDSKNGPKVNGFNTPVKEIENDDDKENIQVNTTEKGVSVDEMLADFVDEVNEVVDLEE